MVEEFETFHQLFRRGIEMTHEISAALRMEGPGYLRSCAKAPRRRLSALFDPETGPAVPYFMQTIHLMRRLRDVGYEYDEGELAEFMRSSGESLETLRRFAVDLTPHLDAGKAAQLKSAVYVFRVAEELFFKDFREGGTLIRQTFCRVMGESVGILAARHFLRDIASPLAAREEQMERVTRLGDCPIGAQPQWVVLAGLTPEAQEHFTAAMRRAKGHGGKGRQVNERQRMDRYEVVTEMRRLKGIAVREHRKRTWGEIVEWLRRSPVYAKKLLGVSDDSWIAYAKRRG